MSELLDDARDGLTREVGPLPVWGWLVALVGGVGVGFMITRGLGSGSGSGGRTPANSETGGSLVPGGSGAVGGAVGLPFAPAIAGDAVDDGFQDNTEWRAAALAALQATGQFGALETDRALGLYLEGRQLDTGQAEIIERALDAVGMPPFPPAVAPAVNPPASTDTPSQGGGDVIGRPVNVRPLNGQDPTQATPAAPAQPIGQTDSSSKPAPTVTKPANPTPVKTEPTPSSGDAPELYTIRQGDTLSAIGRRYGIPWQDIVAFNNFLRPGAIPNPDRIFPGQQILIPTNLY